MGVKTVNSLQQPIAVHRTKEQIRAQFDWTDGRRGGGGGGGEGNSQGSKPVTMTD